MSLDATNHLRSVTDPAFLDDLDRAIVDALVRDGRISYKQLGDEVALSANAAADRVKALQRRGVIKGFTAVLDDRARGRNIEAVIDVVLRDNAVRAAFEKHVREMPAIAEAVHLTGPFDYQIRVACADPAEIDRTIAILKNHGGVKDTQTRVVLRRVT